MEIEENFDYDSIVSLSVLEHEKEIFTIKNDKDMIEKFEVASNFLTIDILSGIISQKDYLESLTKKINEYKAKLKKSKGKIAKTCQAHIILMQEELDQIGEEEEKEEQEDQNQENQSSLKPNEDIKSSTISHEALYEHNISYKNAYDIFEETKEALSYLKSIGATKQCEHLLEKAGILYKIIKKIQQGQEVPLEIIPIAPQDITDMSENERIKRISPLIEFCTKKSAEAKWHALVALRAKDQDAAKAFKQEMVENKAKAKQLKSLLSNPWAIPPEIGVKSLTKLVPLVNDDVKPGVIEASFKFTSLDKDLSITFLIYWSFSGGIYESPIRIRCAKGCTECIDLKNILRLPKGKYSTLFRKNLKFDVKREVDWWKGKINLCTVNVKLDNFASESMMQLTVPFSIPRIKVSDFYRLKNMRGDISMEDLFSIPHINQQSELTITLRINKSLRIPEYKQVTEKIEFVDQILPVFKTPEGNSIKQLGAKGKAKKIAPQREEGVSCYNPNCARDIEFSCDCTSPPTFSCKKHAILHCQSSTLPHNLTSLILKPAESTKELMLNFLREQKSKTDTIKAKMITSFYQTISNLENVFEEALKEIDNNPINIVRYFDKIRETEKISTLEKDPVLRLLVLQSSEAIEKAEKILAINNDFGRFNNMISLIDQAISRFNEEKSRDIEREKLFELLKTDLNFDKEAKNLQQALFKYKEAIKANPINSDAYNEIGSIFTDEKRYEEAIKYFNHAIRINPNEALYYKNKGIALIELGRREEAMECLHKAITIDQNNSDAYSGIGYIFYIEKRYEEAVKYYNDAIRINPNKAAYYENKGNALRALGRIEELVICLDKARGLS